MPNAVIQHVAQAERPAHKIEAELTKLCRDAGVNYYQRIRLALELERNYEFLVIKHKGDDIAARADVERTYFRDLSGLATMTMLIAVYNRYPHESAWKDKEYRLLDMLAQYEVDTKRDKEKAKSAPRLPVRERPPESRSSNPEQATECESYRPVLDRKETKTVEPERPVKVEVVDKPEQSVESVIEEAVVSHPVQERVEESVEEAVVVIQTMEERIRELEQENAALRARVAELEQMIVTT